MNFIRYITNINDKNSISNKTRSKTFNLFKNYTLLFKNPLKIVDLGGTEEYWKMMNAIDPELYDITLINLENIKITLPNIKFKKMDVIDTNFDNFDIIFSHSLIEHLDKKEELSRHIIESGKPYFIQTPYKHFPIESHYLIPFFQYLPYKLKLILKDMIVKGDDPNTINILTYKDLKLLFPNSSVFKIKICGFTQSLIAYKQ